MRGAARSGIRHHAHWHVRIRTCACQVYHASATAGATYDVVRGDGHLTRRYVFSRNGRNARIFSACTHCSMYTPAAVVAYRDTGSGAQLVTADLKKKVKTSKRINENDPFASNARCGCCRGADNTSRSCLIWFMAQRGLLPYFMMRSICGADLAVGRDRRGVRGGACNSLASRRGGERGRGA